MMLPPQSTQVARKKNQLTPRYAGLGSGLRDSYSSIPSQTSPSESFPRGVNSIFPGITNKQCGQREREREIERLEGEVKGMLLKVNGRSINRD